MAYKTELTPAALRDLKKLSKGIASGVIETDLPKLAKNPRPRGAKPLRGQPKKSPEIWRIHCWSHHDYVVCYTINDKERVVWVTRVRDRKDIYRHLL